MQHHPLVVCDFEIFFGTTNMVVEGYQATLDREIYRDLAQPCGAFEYGKFLQHIINLKRLANDHLRTLIKEPVNPYLSHPLVHLEG